MFDIIFLDPPFHSDLLTEVIQVLAKVTWLRTGAVIYVEAMRGMGIDLLIPQHWRIEKQKHTSQVDYYLIAVT